MFYMTKSQLNNGDLSSSFWQKKKKLVIFAAGRIFETFCYHLFNLSLNHRINVVEIFYTCRSISRALPPGATRARRSLSTLMRGWGPCRKLLILREQKFCNWDVLLESVEVIPEWSSLHQPSQQRLSWLVSDLGMIIKIKSLSGSAYLPNEETKRCIPISKNFLHLLGPCYFVSSSSSQKHCE